MVKTSVRQPVRFFNHDGDLKDEKTIIDIYKNSNNYQMESALSSLTPEQLTKLLRRLKIMCARLAKEKAIRKDSDALWASSLSLEDIKALCIFMEQDISAKERFCVSSDNKKYDDAQQTIMGIISQGMNKETPKPLPSLAHTALKVANHNDANSDTQTVNIGDTITIKYCDEPYETYRFTLMSENEENRPGDCMVSVASSLGTAVYGFKIGSKINWKSADNNNEATIIEIEKAQILGGHIRVHNKN